jgi:hypothetical protein
MNFAVLKRRDYTRSHDEREVHIGSASSILAQLAVSCYYDVMRLCAIIWQPYACSEMTYIVRVRRFCIKMYNVKIYSIIIMSSHKGVKVGA